MMSEKLNERPDSIPLACALGSNEFAARRQEVMEQVVTRAVETVELADGYALRFSAEFPLKTLTDFIHYERDCCGFMTFELVATPNQFELRLRGSAEIKQFIQSNFSSSMDEVGTGAAPLALADQSVC